MPRRLISLILASLVATALLPAVAASAQDVPDPTTVLAPRSCADDAPICAGYGHADNTWHVGAGAGQYSEKAPQEPADGLGGGEIDPHNHSLVQRNSYGVQSRLSFRTIVVEDAQGDQVAFVKSDNYLAMDALLRRVGQILLQNQSNVSYDEIMHMASHNHFSPMYSTPSWGVWIFQDAFDLRAFEYQARQMASSILEAEANLTAAKMGATTIEHRLFKGMVARRGVADDGTPVGYPSDFGDFGLSVVRFDTMDDEPIGSLVNWGMHPEGLEADNLITAEFLAPLERFVHRATGSNVVFGQGDVGSAESGPARPYDANWPAEVPRQWDDAGHAQVERGAFLLAKDVIKAYNNIAAGQPSEAPFEKNFVPFTDDFDVAAGNAFIPGPYSNPYPGVSNCRTEPTMKGDTGIPIAGLPDCERDLPFDHPAGAVMGMIWDSLQAHGLPVPSHYAPSAFTGVEENLRLKLQAFKLGEVILMSCACEAQVDLILNLETRVDEEQDNLWLGYDWTKRLDCTQANAPHGEWVCVRKANEANPSNRALFDSGTEYRFSDLAYERMMAQLYNDAGERGGWDAPKNAAHAGTDPDDTTKIWGNFTHEELPEDLGYKVPIGVGHAGDYNGYTVSYREYMAYDHYRKALTAYGPHTAEYMNHELAELASELNGGPDVVARAQAAAASGDAEGAEAAAHELEREAGDESRAAADEARMVAWTTTLGAASAAAWEGWTNTLPNDKGPAEGTEQPKDITRFEAATFSWRGGSNAIDNPTVVVERKTDDGWELFADQSGEIQTKLDFPNGVEGVGAAYQGTHDWIWTANFEAFNASPAEIGSTPAGTYRFVVEGVSRQGFANVPYEFPSDEFTVSPWNGLAVTDARAEPDGSTSFTVNSNYPDTYESVFPYVTRHMRGEADRGELRPEDIRQFCDTCSFRPWATKGVVKTASVTVVRADGSTSVVPATLAADGRWIAATNLFKGDIAYVEQGGVEDNYGETNGQRSATIEGVRETAPPPAKITTALSLIVHGRDSGRRLGARLYVASSSSKGIAGQKIDFYADGVLIGSGTTGSQGTAIFNPPSAYERAGSYEARYAGNAKYTAASSRPL